MKRTLATLAATGLLAVTCSGVFAQTRYTPAGTTTSPSTSTPVTTGTTPPKTTTTTPTTTAAANPDPMSLTLAFSGAAAAVGYVMRRKREAV